MIAAELTQAQLLIVGLLSGGGVVGLIIKWLVASPEREMAAYQRGVADEARRSDEDIAALRAALAVQDKAINRLRTGLLRLAVASDLTQAQRAEIATALGFSHLPDDSSI